MAVAQFGKSLSLLFLIRTDRADAVLHAVCMDLFLAVQVLSISKLWIRRSLSFCIVIHIVSYKNLWRNCWRISVFVGFLTQQNTIKKLLQ